MNKPPLEDWEKYDAYMAAGRSATKAAEALRVTKEKVIQGMMRCSDWLRLSGWSDAFSHAICEGFSLSDAELHADQAADFNMRRMNGEA